MISVKFSEDYYNPETRDGFRIAEMTKRYWAVQMKVLGEIDAVCSRHEIRWFAEFGTLLGAVRHRGFIPWDDDMDITMFREDYEKFLQVAPDELPGTYKVFDARLNPGYDDPLGRVVNNGRIQFDPAFLGEFCGCPYTAGVDIFPMDGIYEDTEVEQDRCDRARMVRKALEMVSAGARDSSECRILIRRISQREGIRLPENDSLQHALAELRNRIYSECPAETASHVAYMNGWTSGGRYRYAREWFDRTVNLPFEEIEVPAPSEYDRVLQVVYGDYMVINRGGGVAHPYPVYRMQQDILTEHLVSHPDERLSAYIAATADRHMEHDEKCTEILDMCDRVMDMIRTKVSGDKASIDALLRGMAGLLDSLEQMISEDYSPEVTALVLTDRIRALTVSGTSAVEDISAYLSGLRECITELYRGHDPIRTGEPADE